MFGALMSVAIARFAWMGWVEELYIGPSYHFTYWGFHWVKPWPAWGMTLHFLVLGAASICITVGAWTRRAALVFVVGFTYVELLDKATYLNHYYLVSLLALLLVFVPSEATWSLDARRRAHSSTHVPRAAYLLLRIQVAVVYVFAGLAKLSGDWLFSAEPLRTWLSAYQDIPVLGPLLAETATAYAFSWFGAVFDLVVVFALLWHRTRRWAYVVCVVFHLSIWLLFPVGMFSWVMLASATLFFGYSWPDRLGLSAGEPEAGRKTALSDRWLALGAVFVAVQLLVPLRHVLYPGQVNWTEEGFRFAWRVMLIEKTGQLEYEVLADGARFRVFPRKELPPFSYKMMSTQPDMIHQYAKHVADRFRAKGYAEVSVHAHAWVSLNGRPSQPIVDPLVDLGSLPYTFLASEWIVPLFDANDATRTPVKRLLSP